LVLLLPFKAELLEASNWTIWVIPTPFPNNHAAYQDGSALIYRAGTVQFGLKSLKLNFNIFPDQHSHNI
jgi:hypothetical protein